MAANARRLRGTSRKACSAHRARGAFAAIWEIISARNARLRFRDQWVATRRFGVARGIRGSFPRRAQSSWCWIALRGDACSLPPQGSSEALPLPPPPASMVADFSLRGVPGNWLWRPKRQRRTQYSEIDSPPRREAQRGRQRHGRDGHSPRKNGNKREEKRTHWRSPA